MTETLVAQRLVVQEIAAVDRAPISRELAPGQSTSFGASLVRGAVDFFVPDILGVCTITMHEHGYPTITNHSRRPLVVENPEGGGEYIKIASGRIGVPIPFETSRIVVATSEGPLEVLLLIGPEVPRADVPGGVSPVVDLDPTAKYFQVLVALCEPRLRDPNSPVIPTVSQILKRLGNRDGFTARSVASHIDYLAREKFRLREGHDDDGKADWQRAALISMALRYDVVTAEHLALLGERATCIEAPRLPRRFREEDDLALLVLDACQSGSNGPAALTFLIAAVLQRIETLQPREVMETETLMPWPALTVGSIGSLARSQVHRHDPTDVICMDTKKQLLMQCKSTAKAHSLKGRLDDWKAAWNSECVVAAVLGHDEYHAGEGFSGAPVVILDNFGRVGLDTTRRGRPPTVPKDWAERLIWHRLAGLTFRAIGDLINSEGIPAPAGARWRGAAVDRILASTKHLRKTVDEAALSAYTAESSATVRSYPSVQQRPSGLLVATDDTDQIAAASLRASAVYSSLPATIREAVMPEIPPAEHLAAVPLTELRLEIIAMLAAGMKDDQIARLTDLSVRTIRAHIAAMMKDLGVTSRFCLGAAARDRGWIPAMPLSEDALSDQQLD